MVKYDHGNVVLNLIESHYEFGVSARAWDHLPLYPELIEEILARGPNEDGMYDNDDELMSEEEVGKYLRNLNKLTVEARRTYQSFKTFSQS